MEVREAVSAASVLPAQFSAGPGLEAEGAVNQLLGGERDGGRPARQSQAGLQGGHRGLGSAAVTGGLLHHRGHHTCRGGRVRKCPQTGQVCFVYLALSSLLRGAGRPGLGSHFSAPILSASQ